MRDPAVTTWAIALAPQPKPAPLGRHWWRDLVTTHHRDARDAWERLRESEPFLQHEAADFVEAHPPPRLKDAMVGLSVGKYAPRGYGVAL
jgi:hypothetical protein